MRGGGVVRAILRPYSPHPNAQPDYTQLMIHCAHTPIPLDYMSETRFMTEKSSTLVTKRPQALTVSPARMLSFPGLKMGKKMQKRRNIYTVYILLLPFTAIYCHLLPFIAIYCRFPAIYRHLPPFTAIFRHFPPFSPPFFGRSRFHQAPIPQVPDKPYRGDPPNSPLSEHN